jgi:ribonuclease T2
MKSIRPLEYPMPRSLFPVVLPALAVIAGVLAAQSTPAPFDYYVLSLSWAPAFCSQANEAARNPQECAAGRHIGFITHGLWPENANGRGPESCGTAKPVPKAVINLVLPAMYSPGLIQHEWATHGICTGLNPFAYFSNALQVRAAVQIPVQITSIENQVTVGPQLIERQFAEANPSFPKTAFRTSCSNRTFQEERICFDKNLKPRECSVAVAECKSPAIVIPPPL